MRRSRVILAPVLALVVLAGGAAVADSTNGAPVTPATTYHGTPGNTPGFTDEARGASPNGDGGMHNIAGNPGQSGARDGRPPACTMHGGIGAANKNC